MYVAEPTISMGYQPGIDDEFYSLLAEAYGFVGKLNGICSYVPNLDVYIKLLSVQEVCASCELENIPVRFYDFFENAHTMKGSLLPSNLLKAIEYAKAGTKFSENFVKRLHGILATSEIADSKYRYNQGITQTDVFYRYGSHPIPADWIKSAMLDMEKYVSHIEYRNALFVAARIQYQLEILDPFDKYSRAVARIIAVSALRWGGLLTHPALWLSAYLHDLTIEYKDRIVAAYRQGEELFGILWIKFFLIAVIASSNNAMSLIESLTSARQEHEAMLPHISNGNKSIEAIYEYVANTIIVNVRQISDALGLSFSSVTKVVKAFEEAGILRQVTKKERYRQFGYAPVLALIEYT
jgi:Fic family protein